MDMDCDLPAIDLAETMFDKASWNLLDERGEWVTV